MAKRTFGGVTSKLIASLEEVLGCKIGEEETYELSEIVEDYTTAAHKSTSAIQEATSSPSEAFTNAVALLARTKGKGDVFNDINESYLTSTTNIIECVSALVKNTTTIMKILKAFEEDPSIVKVLVDNDVVSANELDRLTALDDVVYKLSSQIGLNLGVTGIAQSYLDGAKDLLYAIYSKIDGRVSKDDLIEIADVLGIDTVYDIKDKNDLRSKSATREAAKRQAAKEAEEYLEKLGARRMADLTAKQLQRYNEIMDSWANEQEDDDDFYTGSKSEKKKKFSFKDDDEDEKPKFRKTLYDFKGGILGSKKKKLSFKDDNDDEPVSFKKKSKFSFKDDDDDDNSGVNAAFFLG